MILLMQGHDSLYGIVNDYQQKNCNFINEDFLYIY
jgi:hypothetical protein